MDSKKGKIALLQSIGLFANAGETNLNLIADCLHGIRFPSEGVIIKEGDTDDRMFIVKSGQIQICHEDKIITTLSDGDVIGELSLLDSKPRSMSAIAKTNADLYFIDSADFKKLMLHIPEIASGVIGVLASRFRTLSQKNIEQLKTREAYLKKQVEDRTKDLQTKNEELIKVQKFKEQFLANMSHEIRTPLNAIVGMVNLLRKTKLETHQSNYLKYIKEASQNLQVIIDEILDFSKLEAGKVEIENIPFSVHEVIDLTYNILKFKTEEKQIDFKVKIDERIADVQIGDPVRLNQILVNLTGNAIKFTEKGIVRIEARLLEQTGASHQKIEFRVSDSGIGIKKEQQDKIFDKFTQAAANTKRKFGGTGLGLAISKQLVELQGGTMGLVSEYGNGSTFYFTLSYETSEKLNRVDQVKSKLKTNSLRGISILLAEDNEFNVMVAVDTLKMEVENISIDVAENGHQAIKMLQEKNYDLILMDIQMPEMDGYEATVFIRNQLDSPKCNIPIIAMTASVTKKEVQHCLDIGMNSCLAKPFEAEDLLANLATALNRI